MTKSATPELIALLNSGTQLVYADLYQITLVGGGFLYYTGADKLINLPWLGRTYLVGPLIKRGRTRMQVGVQVDSLDISLSAPDSVQVNSKPLMAFIAAGGLDGARIELARAFMPSWQVDPVGALLMFSGRVNDVSMGRYEARISVQSDLELLDTQVPRNLYQPGCVNTLYDTACGVNRASLTVTSAVSGGITPTRSRFSAALGQAAGYFELGVASFTTGPNAGVARTVKSFASGVVETIAPFPFAPQVGNSFTIVPGCDKTVATCNGRFSNKLRFRGFPFIPKPETVT
jgi:uncharacterized phage protein (TIGR02218 family)